MQAAFFEAVVNREHTVFGRRLHDLCLYDALFLTLLENPLWVGGSPTIADFEEAVLVCSLPPERFTRAQLAPQTTWEKLTRSAWRRRNPRRNLAAEFSAWEAYVADFLSEPETWDGDGSKGGTAKAPWILSLATAIEQKSNMTWREIMTAPIGLMLWKAAAIAEVDGNGPDMMTAEEIEMAAEQAAAFATESEEANG